MNLSVIDWVIGIGCTLLVLLGGVLSLRFIKGVADFVVAGRNVRKYLALSSEMAAGLGLVSIAIAAQEGFIRGFSYMWIAQISLVITSIVFGGFGFVIMRYRALKLMTLAQFHELRYSKGVRLTVGYVLAVSGILNLAIFPIVGAQFLVHFIGLPEHTTILGPSVPTTSIIMFFLTGLPLIFALMGGMVTVIFTEYLQSIIIAIVLLVSSTIIVSKIGIHDLHQALLSLGAKSFNPFDYDSYGPVWMIQAIIAVIPAYVAFAPTMQKMASVDDPKTTKIVVLLGNIMGNGRTMLIILWGVAALAIMGPTPPAGMEPEQYQRAATAMFLGQHLPNAVRGMALAGMIAAGISTVAIYLLTWAAVIVNDIICVTRKTPMSQRSHMWALRLTIAAIAVFLYLFGVVYRPTESILAYITVTGSMFLGAGIILIGGLYWKRATTPAAYVCMIVCCVIPIIDVLCKQLPTFEQFFGTKYPLTSPQSALLGLVLSTVLFVVISLVTKRTDKALAHGILDASHFNNPQAVAAANETPSSHL
jgi:SSS family solute:Na+ symporter